MTKTYEEQLHDAMIDDSITPQEFFERMRNRPAISSAALEAMSQKEQIALEATRQKPMGAVQHVEVRQQPEIIPTKDLGKNKAAVVVIDDGEKVTMVFNENPNHIGRPGQMLPQYVIRQFSSGNYQGQGDPVIRICPEVLEAINEAVRADIVRRENRQEEPTDKLGYDTTDRSEGGS